jgi:hypothetical protein
VDTAELRSRIAERTAQYGLKIDEHATVAILAVTISVPEENLPPGMVRLWGGVAVRLYAPQAGSGALPDTIWQGDSPRRELTSYRLLSSNVLEALDAVLDQLGAAMGSVGGEGTRRRLP